MKWFDFIYLSGIARVSNGQVSYKTGRTCEAIRFLYIYILYGSFCMFTFFTVLIQVFMLSRLILANISGVIAVIFNITDIPLGVDPFRVILLPAPLSSVQYRTRWPF